ncbi:MAG: 5-formyltetrahydrofolate cyclo-ligase [Rhodobacteraceae bacterium]|nr:5-formyltetrahydrofolate cyclo-ligase [Paracoccaceae bacterium]
MHTSSANAKSHARKEAAARRKRAFDGPDAADLVAAANQRLSGFLAAQFGPACADIVLAGYMPMRSELDPLPAMTAHPGPVCVPVVPGRAQPLLFHRWSPDMPMIEGAFGAHVPARADMLVPQALIVPMLGFDRRGYRLGYGGGFYDRTLQALRAQGGCLAVGFAFDAQELAELPIDENDQRLDIMITPTRMMRFSG